VARVLIVGCGCHGRSLAGELVGRGHVVRGTTRDPDAVGAIEAAGAEAVLADPDRLATLMPALEHAGVVVLLLGSAAGSRESVAALHGARLESLLVKLLDTTVRGVLYEACGSVDADLLRQAAGQVQSFCSGSRIPWALLEEPRDSEAWLGSAVGAVERVLAG
jgi:3-hydroxyisobutyrate dehydrogenase-like beta-hydroxyacid dehydrogenase